MSNYIEEQKQIKEEVKEEPVPTRKSGKEHNSPKSNKSAGSGAKKGTSSFAGAASASAKNSSAPVKQKKTTTK